MPSQELHTPYILTSFHRIWPPNSLRIPPYRSNTGIIASNWAWALSDHSLQRSLVNTWFGRRWVMGMSAIVTGIFLFAYAGVNTAAASLAFACITGMLANFGRFNCPLKPSEQRIVADPSCNRVRGHVRLHARVFSRSASRNWNWNCSGFATLRWTGGH